MLKVLDGCKLSHQIILVSIADQGKATCELGNAL